jgi:hypothetical protein
MYAMLFSALSIFMVLCTRTVERSVPAQQPKLVLHGYIAVDSTIKVAIGRTIPFNIPVADSVTYINDAWVLLYENGVFLDTLRYSAGQQRYSAQRIAQQGKTYTIVAGAFGFETIEASAFAPLPVETISVAQVNNARTDNAGILQDDVTFTLNDPARETNFYLTALYPPGGIHTFMCISTIDPVIEKPSRYLIPFEEDCIFNDEIMFTDQSFNGTLKEITISAEANRLKPQTDHSTGNVSRSFLKVYNISKDYYRYLKNTLSIEIDPEVPSLTEPVTVKGNVKNGYGLFTIFTVATDTLR